jgi:hypothetical protein
MFSLDFPAISKQIAINVMMLEGIAICFGEENNQRMPLSGADNRIINGMKMIGIRTCLRFSEKATL